MNDLIYFIIFLHFSKFYNTYAIFVIRKNGKHVSYSFNNIHTWLLILPGSSSFNPYLFSLQSYLLLLEAHISWRPCQLTIIVHSSLVVFLIKDPMRLYAEWLGGTVVEDHLNGVTHLSPNHWPC